VRLKEKTEWLWLKYHFTPKKQLGQHFLIDPLVLDRIVESLHLRMHDEVLEIGAGTGTLTERLVQEGIRVSAVEVDESLCQILKEELKDYPNVKIICEDISQFSLEEQFKGPFKIVGNLPYQIASSLLLDLIKRKNISLLVVMVQREVAERLLSPPGCKKRGALTVLMQHYALIEKIIDVPSHAFIPPPRVASSLLRIEKRKIHCPEEAQVIFRVVRAAFSSRRRTLINALSGALRRDKNFLREKLRQAGIDEKLRAEDLAGEDFLKLSRVLREEIYQKKNCA
jgi:16S rRNA (adenine1518-N6/adenine1519-N6)-dimethyltransferase